MYTLTYYGSISYTIPLTLQYTLKCTSQYIAAQEFYCTTSIRDLELPELVDSETFKSRSAVFWYLVVNPQSLPCTKQQEGDNERSTIIRFAGLFSYSTQYNYRYYHI